MPSPQSGLRQISLGPPKDHPTSMTTPSYFWVSRSSHHCGIVYNFTDYLRLGEGDASPIWHIYSAPYSSLCERTSAEPPPLTLASRWLILRDTRVSRRLVSSWSTYPKLYLTTVGLIRHLFAMSRNLSVENLTAFRLVSFVSYELGFDGSQELTGEPRPPRSLYKRYRSFDLSPRHS